MIVADYFKSTDDYNNTPITNHSRVQPEDLEDMEHLVAAYEYLYNKLRNGILTPIQMDALQKIVSDIKYYLGDYNQY